MHRLCSFLQAFSLPVISDFYGKRESLTLSKFCRSLLSIIIANNLLAHLFKSGKMQYRTFASVVFTESIMN